MNRIFRKIHRMVFNKKTTVVDLESTLETLVIHELARKTSMHKFGVLLEKSIITDEGLQTLGELSNKLLIQYSTSILLIYIKTVALAKSDKLEEAHTFISKEIVESRLNKNEFTDIIAKKRTISLLKIWRVLDLIAREKMKWADGDNIQSTQYELLDFLPTDETLKSDEFDVSLSLFYAEPSLQGKNHKNYLNLCNAIFNKSETLEEKLKVIFAMRRQGIRRVATYHDAYNLARKLYAQLEYEIDRAIETAREEKSVKSCRLIRTIMNVSRVLDFGKDLKKGQEAIVEIALSKEGKPTIWTAAFALVEVDAIGNYELSKKIIDFSQSKPTTTHDIQHFLSWAELTQEYTMAYKFFVNQPSKIKKHKCALGYVKILQRLGKFEEAEQIAKGVHSAMLSRAHQLCPFASWSLVKRVGELGFLQRTSKIYTTISQPTKPLGVIFITPRSIEQLRKTPIVVLMELKRMGWAIIPLSEGLLPLEKTGIPSIDKFIGGISMNRTISKKALPKLNNIHNQFKVNLKKGYMEWEDIDMSHVIWEESAINRRVYEVDYTCPAMQEYLNNIYIATKSSAVMLENIYNLRKEINLRIGFMIQFNARLPDALYRFYCEKKGDPDNFFCVHSANGYQNYFENFSTNISTKGIMRNMTRHPETKSGSFPVPAEFEKYYMNHKNESKHILELVEGVTKVKRSTSGESELPADAKLVLAQIEEWKSKGGKVVCAFGKVVCDSGVPYDGGPAHSNMKDWLNHTIESVKNSNTLLLIKPHPHELNQEISTFGNEFFSELIDVELNKNVIFLGHKWFDIHMLKDIVDLGLIYNGTTSIELGVLGIPSILCSFFAPIDYPIGHAIPKNKKDYSRMVRFEKKTIVDSDIKERAAVWLYYMGGKNVTLDYRYHSRPLTNKVVYPPYWFDEDIYKYLSEGDKNVTELALRAIN